MTGFIAIMFKRILCVDFITIAINLLESYLSNYQSLVKDFDILIRKVIKINLKKDHLERDIADLSCNLKIIKQKEAQVLSALLDELEQ